MEPKPYNILLVEDEADHAELLKRSFGRAPRKYDLVIVAGLAQAGSYLKESTPDLVITDLRLPDGLGTDLISPNEDGRTFPVVVMTSQGHEEIAVEAMKAGALDYVVKSASTFREMPHIADRAIREWKHIVDSKEAERTIQALVESTVGVTGQEFFDNAVKSISHWLNSEIVVLGTTLGSENIKVLAMQMDGETTHNFKYRILKSPDEHVFSEGYTAIPDEVFTKFPEAYGIFNKPLKGYVGIPLTGKTGKPNGILSAWSSAPLRLHDKAEDVLNIIAAKASAEIERLSAEEEKIGLYTQLRQAQKMEAIGTLAGGIAHDFNNILAAIIGYTELSIFDLPDSHPSRSQLDLVLLAAQRAKNLVQQILTFSRESSEEWKKVDMVAIIREGVKFLRASLPTTIELQLEINVEEAMVMADPTQIHQVLMNLGTNAAQAMQESGGLLKIVLSRLEIDADSYEHYPEMGLGAYQRLTVSDTGHGIGREVLDRIFEPFFTTKEVGQGTGMGLSVVHGIVKSYGGTLKIESSIGRGSNFHVFIPAVEADSVEEIEPPDSPPFGTETILFIDDETMLVDAGKRMLELLGYTVATSTDPIEALEYFRENQQTIDLVITDMTMPNLTGDQLSIEMLKIRDDIPIILCTGYSEKISKEQAISLGVKEFILKPFIMFDLAKTIRKALGD